MTDFKIRFRDPQSGRQMEVEAEGQKTSWSKGTVEESFDAATVTNDGQIDVMVDESVWSFKKDHHLGISTESMSTEDLSALKRALNDQARNIFYFS